MSLKEFESACTGKVAGPHQKTTSKNTVLQPTSATPSPSPSTPSATQDYSHLGMCKIFTFIDDTYQDLRRYNSKLQKNLNGIQLMQTINKYKNGCNEVYAKTLESYNMCHKLAQNIIRTIDIFKELCTCLSDLEEYNYRMCEILSIFIVCELRLSVDASKGEQFLIAQRIIYIMRRHLVQEEEHETLHNILRTLVFIPKLFNARDIMCAIFGEFIPIKPVLEVKVLPDKLYMLYIIVFYRWMMMQKDDDDKMLIVNFAESFMKPSVSLCSNHLYGAYLPMYTTHSTATRTILTNLKYYRDVRNASLIDNALKKIGTVVNLCDDEEDDDIIVLDTSPTTDFAEVFASARLEPLRDSMSNIKLEEKTVVSMVDLTEDDEPENSETSISERHDKWLNDFQSLAKHYRESQILLEKQQNNNLISNGKNHTVICLDSDSEEEDENSATVCKETSTLATSSQQNNSEDLFVDNYPPTNTPINCDSGLDSLDAEDENDVTKISPRFLPGALRTYQAKKNCLSETEGKNDSDADEANKSHDMYKAYRRDSIHISSTPPDRLHTEDDDSTDVQDENDDLPDEEGETYTHLLTTSKRTENDIIHKQIRPMGPYPTYNMYNDKVFSQTISRYPQQQQKYQDKQYYHSDCSEIKAPKKQKKRVQFNTNPLGPAAFGASHKTSLKSALQQPKYKASDAPEYFHLRDFKRFSCPPSIAGSTSTLASNSTSSSIKQQEHLAAAPTLFRDVFDKTRLPQRYHGLQSPSSSPAPSCSLKSPSTPSTARKKYRLPKTIKLRRPSATANENEEHYSIIRNPLFRLSDMPSYEESSDDCIGMASDSDMMLNERYKNDTKLRKRCAVVITPTKELLMFERKRDEMYNEILQKQRRKLELRALEKKREKERDDNKEQFNSNRDITTDSDKVAIPTRKTRSYNEIFMSSDSLYDTNFEMRTRKHSQGKGEELEPLNIQIEMTESTTTTLLSQIDAHLDKSATDVSTQCKVNEPQQENQANNDINRTTCDIRSEKGQTKMSELNLLADIAQHLSPYQLDLPDNNNPPRTPSPSPPLEPPPLLAPQTTKIKKKVPKEKVTVTEHLIIKSLDSLSEKTKSQLNKIYQHQQPSTSYEHEPKLNITSILKSSPCTNLIQNQSENNDNISTEKEINANAHTGDTLEKILEESINVLKSATSPRNPLHMRTHMRLQTHSDSTIPLLISNVESLNHSGRNDNASLQQSDDKVDLLPKDSTEVNSVNYVLSENELLNIETSGKTIDDLVSQNENLNKSEEEAVLMPTVLNSTESSVMRADSEIITDETEIPQTLKPTPLMPADLSDISLESENTKHLPEIAEPSPVVTDMSDNSNESEAPNSNNNADTSGVTEMSVPDLSLVMPNIAQPTTMPSTPQDSLDSSFNQLNCTLNTPTKLDIVMPRHEEEHSNNSVRDLNTSLKFDIQSGSGLHNNDMLLKNALEPENDSNVTKFLDLILNKTVTDAESETRDKIIKELNALTSDTATTASVMPENISNNEIRLETKLCEDGENKEMEKEEEKKSETNANILKEQTNTITENQKTQNIFENSSESHIENNLCDSNINIAQSNYTFNEQDVPQTPDENNKFNPPIETPSEENRTELTAAKCLDTISPNSLGLPTKNKLPAIKQTFNIKCRVRLKRLNIDDNCKSNKRETWMAIPIANAEEPTSANNYNSKCDTVTETTPAIKKSCLKYNKHASEDFEDKISATFINVATAADVMPNKKPKLDIEQSQSQTLTSQPPSIQTLTQITPALAPIIFNNISTPKSKSKHLKTVSFDLPNLTEEIRDNISSNHKQKSKSHTSGLGFYLKNSRQPKKLPDNTLRAAETLQLFVNSINDSTRTPPTAEYNKKRSPIKNKCIAEDETPRPPPASTLMGTPPCKKTCTEKSRSQIISSKCKDQLVSSLTTPSISSITSDITTARIYTSSPLDQTLPEYDDNVDTVADSELILPTTSGSLRRKLKRPKKSLARPEPADDISTDDISNQPECNGEDDTDAVVDNEDDVFPQELLPIPTANEHILEEIVSSRQSHIGTGTVIRDDYMNIEATDTVPVYLFNDESRDLTTPEPIQSSDTTNVVDSSSYLNNSTSTTTNNVVATIPASAALAIGNLEKPMLSPSEHEVSSTQETFYQTPTKTKQTGLFDEKSLTNKDNANISSGCTPASILKQKPDNNNTQNKEEYRNSSNTCLLQNNQVDTTNHSPEMCSLPLTATTTNTTTNINSCKIRKASTHDEILFNELQQQKLQPTNKRKSTPATFCAESTSDNNIASKINVGSNHQEDVKSNGSLIKVEDKFKKLLKEVTKKDRHQTTNELDVRVHGAKNNGVEGGSSPSTTTIIHEEKSKSKRKKAKSSKSSKNKSHSEKVSKIVLKASKLSTKISTNPLIITIPKSKLLERSSVSTPPTPIESQDKHQQSEIFDIPNAKLFIEKDKDTARKTGATSINNYPYQHNHSEKSHAMTKRDLSNVSAAALSKSNSSQSPGNIQSEIVSTKANKIVDSQMPEGIRNTSSTITSKEKSCSSTLKTKKNEKLKTSHYDTSCSITTNANRNNNTMFLKDKYDLIKSKDKQHHHNYDLQYAKEISKEKTINQPKPVTSNNSRSHKSSTKEKIKSGKLKDKQKTIEKSTTQQQTDVVIKLNTSQNTNKSYLSSSTSTTKLVLTVPSNSKQSNSRSSKSSSSSLPLSLPTSSSSSSSSSLPAVILKSKGNLSTTHSSASAAGTASTKVTAATQSTNNVRKKLKIK